MWVVRTPRASTGWFVHLINDGASTIDEILVEDVEYELGDAGGGESIPRRLGPLDPGKSVVLAALDSTEVQTSITFVTRSGDGTKRITAELGRLYDGQGILVPVPVLREHASVARLVAHDSPTLSQAHAYAAPQAQRGWHAFDVGRGVVGYRARSGGIVGFDLLRCERLWQRADIERVTPTLWRERDRLVRLDPPSGQAAQIVAVGEWLAGLAAHELVLLEEHTVVARSTTALSPDWGNEDPTEFEVVWIDIVSGATLSTLTYTGGSVGAWPLGDDVLLSLDRVIARYDCAGKQRWRHTVAGTVMGVVDDRILLSDRQVDVLDAATGERVASLPDTDSLYRHLVTPGALVIYGARRALVFDRITLAHRWTHEATSDIELLATPDTLLALRTHTPESRHPQIAAVTAFELATGARRSEIDVRDMRAGAGTATLAGGSLVMLSVIGGPPVVVVR